MGTPFESEWVCRGTRLRLAEPADAAALFPMISGQTEITDWLCTPAPESMAALGERYAEPVRGTADAPIGIFAVVDSASCEPVGEATITFDGHPGVADIGYWVGREQQGRGHGRDVVELLTHAALEAGAYAVTARVMVGNLASRTVLERAGWTLDHELPARASAAVGATGCGSEGPGLWILSTTRRKNARRVARLEIVPG